MSHIIRSEVIEGVAYELHVSASIRVFNVDAGEVVTHVFYPSMFRAAVEWAKTVETARKVS